MNLIKVGGICAIIFFLLYLVQGVLTAIDGVTANPVESYLRNINNNPIYVSELLLNFVLEVFWIPALLGFYFVLRKAGSVILLALITSFLALAGWVSTAIKLSLTFRLAPAYAQATSAAKPTLALIGSTLLEIGKWESDLNSFLMSIGVLLFSVAIIRTSVIRHWIGWIGIAAGVGLPFISMGSHLRWLGFIGIPALPLFIVWIAAMGVSLLRLREPVEVKTES